jgi:hypothetical protein
MFGTCFLVACAGTAQAGVTFIEARVESRAWTAAQTGYVNAGSVPIIIETLNAFTTMPVVANAYGYAVAEAPEYGLKATAINDVRSTISLFDTKSGNITLSGSAYVELINGFNAQAGLSYQQGTYDFSINRPYLFNFTHNFSQSFGSVFALFYLGESINIAPNVDSLLAPGQYTLGLYLSAPNYLNINANGFDATEYKDYSTSIGFNLTSAVPEPESWAFLLVGFGLIGIRARRQERHFAC